MSEINGHGRLDPLAAKLATELEIRTAERDEARDLVTGMLATLPLDREFLPPEAMKIYRYVKATASRWAR